MIVLFLWRASILKEQYALKNIEYTAAARRFDAEQKFLMDAIDKSQREVAKIKADGSASDAEQLRQAERKSEESGRLLREQTLRAIDRTATIERLTLIIDYRVEMVVAALFVFFGAGPLAVYGFVNWRRLQLKQDELLDLQLKEAREARK